MACPLAFKVENLSEGVELLWRKHEEEVRKIEASDGWQLGDGKIYYI